MMQPMLRAAPALRRHLPRWPTQCEVCRSWTTQALCRGCIDRFALAVPRCSRCGLGLGAPTPACLQCQQDAPPFSATVCGLDYGFPWNQLIGAFKFQGRVELAAPLAARLAHALDAADVAPPDAVLPVPLTAQRLAERGYNQAWELARRVAATRQLPARSDVLQRVLHTPRQQAELSRAERRRNVRGAFFVGPALRPQVAGRRLALVDDVMTTGATVREAAGALLRAGAADVQVWVLARTPDPGTHADATATKRADG